MLLLVLLLLWLLLLVVVVVVVVVSLLLLLLLLSLLSGGFCWDIGRRRSCAFPRVRRSVVKYFGCCFLPSAFGFGSPVNIAHSSFDVGILIERLAQAVSAVPLFEPSL